MNWFLIFYLIGIANKYHLSANQDDGVSIEEEEEPIIQPKVKKFNSYDKFIKKHQDFSSRVKKDTDNFLNSYIKNLKDDQEIVLSRGTGFKSDNRFKSGDVHIRKSSNSQESPEVTESSKLKYSYPFGLGTFLLSGCYLYTGMPDSKSTEEQLDLDEDIQYDSGDFKRKKRASIQKNNYTDMKSFCRRYAKLEKVTECKKIIPGAYTLGTGFDIKYENSENSRRKSIITRYCNYQKFFNHHTVPDIMTANGIYDTKTQTTTFGESSDYMKFVASRSNLDRYTNVFSSDSKNAYGGANNQKILSPGYDMSDDKTNRENNFNQQVNKETVSSDFWLFQIQSTVLIYDLLLDQIRPWNLDPEFLVDFLSLPDSYFYEDASEKFDKFILRYGTHVVVSAKFGGEFKIMHTMQKTKTSSIETFSQQCIQDSMKMFSRSWNIKANAFLASAMLRKENTKSDADKKDKKLDKEKGDTKKSEYASTYISVKGGSQEVAAIVANLNQPDFSDTFIGWLKTVHKYPRAFDFKYEPIVSILDINVGMLFAHMGSKEQKICADYAKKHCKFGFTIEEFETRWQNKLNALKFAITVYLKEPTGLTWTKFYIKKGTAECRFNILNYISPTVDHLMKGGREFMLTMNLNDDESIDYHSINSSLSKNEFFFKKNDEINFMKRNEFWLAKRKTDIYTYQSARLINEPFKSSSKKYFINILGLLLEYNEYDSTVSVANLNQVLKEYSTKTNCLFKVKALRINSTLLSPFISLDIKSVSSHSFKRDSNDFGDAIRRHKRQSNARRCKRIHKTLQISMNNVKNMNPFWIKLWNKVVGVVDYLDPMQLVKKIWDLKYAVMPCELKWSNNLIMVLGPGQQDGKCLKFTAASQGEIFVVMATTPSDQDTWYMFQITTKGVVFYRKGMAILLNEDSAGGTTGNGDIYQTFFICLNYETRNDVFGLYVQYGIQIDSDETSHLYLSYFDTSPLEPAYYSFGSRSADVQVLNARLEKFNEREQTRLRCSKSSTLNRAIDAICDYKCHRACDGCFEPKNISACKKCSTAAVRINGNSSLLCVEKCPIGYEPDFEDNKLCKDVNECLYENECQKNSLCLNTQGSYKCICKDGYIGNGLFCEDINECLMKTDNCSINANCKNLIGSFKCQCRPGFQGDGHVCQDIDECTLLNDCPWNTECQNTKGSYECRCPLGFKMIDQECKEINECAQETHNCVGEHVLCQNLLGSFECVCEKGYAMYNESCHDINECHAVISPCDKKTQKCINTVGSYFCECKSSLANKDNYCVMSEKFEPCSEGFYSLNNKCLDLNECHLNLHDCESDASCVNTLGSYYCRCGYGFVIDQLNNCLDVDECSLGLHHCTLEQTCINTIGSYICQCNQANLTNINNKCVADNGGLNMYCYLLNSVQICECEQGFEIKNSSSTLQICEDIDECMSNPCPPNSKCINTNGKYTCDCLPGFIASRATDTLDCLDLDECSSPCLNTCDPENALCVNQPGSYDCQCKQGFYGNGRVNACFDINECLSNQTECHSSSKCFNTIGSFECKCEDGFYNTGSICEDINECIDQEKEKECFKLNSYCINTPGSYKCNCFSGLRNSDSFECVDIDECIENTHNCNKNSNCVNLFAGFKCQCADGFKWSQTKYQCEDIDECEQNLCDKNSDCVNLNGTYECICHSGWGSTRQKTCQDIDECKQGTSQCSQNSKCFNTPGSYECRCNYGFRGDGFNCYDIDECKENTNACANSVYLECFNTIGSYECKCKHGFISASNGMCIDLNECEEFHPCNENSFCLNTLGSYKCECVSGFEKYQANSNYCYDIDECNDQSRTHECHHYAKCENTYGSYNCSCLDGFFGNGTFCQDIDECSLSLKSKTFLCNDTGICVNTIGHYRCECIDGFVNSNSTSQCIDLNECEYESCFSLSSVGGKDCYSFGLCRNTIGSFICECFEGFEYNHTHGHCSDIDECKRMEHDLNIKDVCRTGPLFMASCVNKCGSYSCECRNTDTTLVDIYDPNRCYSKKQIRDLIINIYNERNGVNIFLKEMNATVESCSQENRIMNKTFPLRFNSFHQFLTNIKDQKWFPIYTDNSKWSEIEFACKINLTTINVLNFENDFKHILIEDPIRKRCSLYDQEELYYEKNLKLNTIFSLALVVDLTSFQSCTDIIEKVDENIAKIVFKKN